jgi:hypothetical protein
MVLILFSIFVFSKHKPWVVDAIEDPPTKSITKSADSTESTHATTTAAAEEKKLEKKLEKQPVEKQWMLLGPYMEQYIVYTGPKSAWLLSCVIRHAHFLSLSHVTPSHCLSFLEILPAER